MAYQVLLEYRPSEMKLLVLPNDYQSMAIAFDAPTYLIRVTSVKCKGSMEIRVGCIG